MSNIIQWIATTTDAYFETSLPVDTFKAIADMLQYCGDVLYKIILEYLIYFGG